MINRKAKGSAAERDLIARFWQAGWAAVRVAGSGSMRHPSPDILAGNALRRIALEVKATQDNSQYIRSSQVNDLKGFARIYGAEAWIAVKFDNRGWFFVSVEELRETECAFVLNHETAKAIGLSFEEMLGNLSSAKG